MKRFLYLLLFTVAFLYTAETARAQFSRYYLNISQPKSIQTLDGGFSIMGSYGQYVRLHRLDQMGDPIWERILWPSTFSGSTFAGKVLIETEDGGYALGWNWNSERYFWRTDEWGDTLWTADLSPIPGLFSLVKAIETHDKGFIATGRVTTDSTYARFQPYLLKIDSLGNVAWMQRYDLDTVSHFGGEGIIETADHGFAFVAYSSDSAATHTCHLIRTDSLGNLSWVESFGTPTHQITPFGLSELANGQWLMYGQYETHASGFLREGWAQWVDTNGQVLQERRYSFEETYAVNAVHQDADGQITFAGTSSNPNGSYSVSRIWEVDSLGQVGWDRYFFWPSYPDYFGKTAQGGYCVMGEQAFVRWASFSLADSQGVVNTNVLEGQFFLDLNANCALDTNESAYTPLPLGIEARNIQTNQSFYAKADSGDFFRLNLPLGSYELIPSAHPYLSYPCTDPDTIDFLSPYQSIRYDVPVQIEDSCPYNQVSIGSAFLRIGDTSQIDVRVWNYGTVASLNTSVEVELDSFLTYISSDSPLVSQVGQVLAFDMDTLAVGETKQVRIWAYLDSTVVPGQAHCLEAHVFPDSICGTGNLWSGANIQAGIKCLGDSIKFSIKNLGNSMLAHRNYLIYIDDVIFRMDSFQLNNGDSINIVDPATAGATYRIEAEQESGYPIVLGDPIAIAFKEGCLPFPSGGFSTGWVNSFYNGNAAPAQAITCLENGTSYDPNDKRAQPFGYDSLHYIRANTPLNYQIRFQNTGTDTAQRIIIVDTLSQFLDPSTLVPGASSHPYRWTIRDQNIVRFIFQPIQLVDSLTNPEGSQGYVMFSIRQQPDNPIGTLIENRAGIYFDFNPPIITNTSFHLIGEDFIRIELLEQPVSVAAFEEDVQVVIAPNPVGSRAQVLVKGGKYQSYTLELFNLHGQRVYVNAAHGNEPLWIEPQGLTKGIYTYKLKGDGQFIQAGRIRLR